MNENRSRLPGRVRRLGALAIVTASLLAGAVSFVGADPAPAGPASPATAGNLAPEWVSHFGNGKYQASPVVAGDFVYAGDMDGYLTKLPLATGTASAPPTFAPTWTTDECFNSILSRPAVGTGRVFVATAAGYVCAFDEDDGAFIWRQMMPRFGWANGPVLVGDTLYATGHRGDVLALDSGTGTPRWTANVGGADPDHQLYGSPVVLDGAVYVGTYDGRLMAITPPAAPGTPATVTELATFPGGQINDALATDGTNLYASISHLTQSSVGTVRVVSLTRQGQVRWNVDTGHNPTYNMRIQAPVVVDGIVYAPTRTNLVYLRSDTGAHIALADTSPNQPTTPTVVNGVAYVGGIQDGGGRVGALQAFDGRTGLRLYYSHTSTVANTVPAVAPDGKVLLGGGNAGGGQGFGVIWAYQPATPRHNS
jgi:outer membrane protein assembly factor BamB